MVYLLLAACLFPELGYLGVWGKLTAGLAGVPVAAPTAGALAQDRRRVGERRCGGYSICCAARPPSRAGTACGGTGLDCHQDGTGSRLYRRFGALRPGGFGAGETWVPGKPDGV